MKGYFVETLARNVNCRNFPLNLQRVSH